VDSGEANPVLSDSDRDGLCDGNCSGKGEDMSENGVRDQNATGGWNETDFLANNSDVDGVLDGLEVYARWVNATGVPGCAGIEKSAILSFEFQGARFADGNTTPRCGPSPLRHGWAPSMRPSLKCGRGVPAAVVPPYPLSPRVVPLPGRRSSSFGAGLLTVLIAVAAGAAAATPVDETRTVSATEYSWVLLYSGGVPEDMSVDVNWTSTVAADVWLMDRANWDNFEAGRPFTADVTQSGLSGHINETIAGARLANGSVYVVLDNSARGATAPPFPPASATFHVQGTTWRPAPASTTNEGGLLILNVIRGLAVAVPLLVIVLLLMRRKNRKKRQKGICEQMAAGNVVGAGAPRPPESFVQPGATPAAPQAYGAPPQRGQQPAPAPSASAPRFCRSCGTPGVTGKAFCMKCGAPFGP
jgi:hypothetical protein